MCYYACVKRTTIMLPTDLKHRAEQVARIEGVSLGELIRVSLEERLQRSHARDPLFADEAVFRGETPTDLAHEHDRYLYNDLH